MSVSVGWSPCWQWSAHLCFKCSSMFFTSWESFDKTGHLMKKDKQLAAKKPQTGGPTHDVWINKCLSANQMLLFNRQADREHQFTVTTRKVLLEYSCTVAVSLNNKMPSWWDEWMRSMSAFHVLAQGECVSMSDLLSVPSGHSLGSQPQDLGEQLTVFVPTEGHPVWGRGRDAGGEHRLVEGLLERDGIWGGWGEGRGVSFQCQWGSDVHALSRLILHKNTPLLSPISSLT